MLANLLAVLGFVATMLVFAVEVVLLPVVGYLLFLTAAAVVIRFTRPEERLGADGPREMATAEAGRLPAPGRWTAPRTRFAVLVPAHDEELLIRRVIGSIQAL